MNGANLVQAWAAVEGDCRQLVRLALQEDLRGGEDITTRSLVPTDRLGSADVVARQAGVACGLEIGGLVCEAFGGSFECRPQTSDGQAFAAGACLATLSGPVHELLTCERAILNFLGRLSGVATQARGYASKIADTKARVYDTRKTTPGWRALEKYAVACGGGGTHRMGLYDAVLIKDNHLAFASDAGISIGESIRRARSAVEPGTVVQIEVDTLAQLDEALDAGPDMVLLDNMPLEQLREAVARRDASRPEVELEASGGVTVETLRKIAETGVERISVGALTHSAKSLDIGLDWR